jgi:SNARE protein 1
MNGDVTSQFKLSNPGPIITNKDVKTKQIYHKTQLNKENLMREKLLGSGTAKAKTSDEPTESVDLTKLIAKQRENQEKLTEEMLRAVRGLKHNVGAVDQILKKDNQGLNKMNETAEKNSDNLKVVNDRLNERVSRTCNCWIWMMLMIILMVFIMMILFMKLFPKRRYGYDLPTSSSSYDSTYKHYIENKTIVIDNQTIHTMEL